MQDSSYILKSFSKSTTILEGASKEVQSPSLKANLSRQERERFGQIVLERIDDVLNFESSRNQLMRVISMLSQKWTDLSLFSTLPQKKRLT